MQLFSSFFYSFVDFHPKTSLLSLYHKYDKNNIEFENFFIDFEKTRVYNNLKFKTRRHTE
nr:MAG TPA: hypothetical protein [Caudoviricetes sp.]